MALLRTLGAAVLIGLSSSGFSGQLAAAEPEELSAKAGCIACHMVQAQSMGPSWVAIAERYRGDDAAVDALRSRVRGGGSGVWGPVPMPPVSTGQVSEEDLGSLLTWVLNH